MQNSLQHKFARKFQMLRSSSFDGFPHVLQDFWRFFNSEPIFFNIVENLRLKFPDMQERVRNLFSSKIKVEIKSEEEAISLSFELLSQMSDRISDLGSFRNSLHAAVYPTEFVAWDYGNNQHQVDKNYLETFRERYLENLCLYIEEQIEKTEAKFIEQSKISNLLLRYKHRSEWFFQSKLWNIYHIETTNQTRKAEKMLALDLYSYLYDQGVDFFIEPYSNRGAVDLISLQSKPEVFWQM